MRCDLVDFHHAAVAFCVSRQNRRQFAFDSRRHLAPVFRFTHEHVPQAWLNECPPCKTTFQRPMRSKSGLTVAQRRIVRESLAELRSWRTSVEGASILNCGRKADMGLAGRNVASQCHVSGMSLPGFMMPWGSSAFLTARMTSRAGPCSASRYLSFPEPTPCSPVQVPS